MAIVALASDGCIGSRRRRGGNSASVVRALFSAMNFPAQLKESLPNFAVQVCL